MRILVKIPATTANLGPGFDALGLALDLWNEAEFAPASTFSLEIEGEGAERLPTDHESLVVQAARKLYEAAGKELPPLKIRCLNRIPPGAGLGSSAAAVLTGLLGANALLGEPFTRDDILQLAAEMEGHPDNVAPALLGGLVVSMVENGPVIARKLAGAESLGKFNITIVVPDFEFPTEEARAVLPEQVPLKDAVQNIGRAVLVAEAFRTGDLELLGRAMDDALHQPYRLPLIPGAREAMQAGREAGAAAVALSGAGPSLVAFSVKRDEAIGDAMRQAFEAAGLRSRTLSAGVSLQGAQVSSRRDVAGGE
jgi:homoserine kinase